MPYAIISTVAILTNFYRNAPLIVGDKDADPELMKFLGAKITTNYPDCGSPPMYVMYCTPRKVLEQLELQGYIVISSQIVQEHIIWTMRKPPSPEQLTETQVASPNDKKIQTQDSRENEDDCEEN